jgi:hypothetical protein
MIKQPRHLGLREESKAVSPLRSATVLHTFQTIPLTLLSPVPPAVEPYLGDRITALPARDIPALATAPV